MITILIGKSGSGKDTALNVLCEECDFKRVVTSTTRPMRTGEVDGIDYNFLSNDYIFDGFEESLSEIGVFVEGRIDTMDDILTVLDGNPKAKEHFGDGFYKLISAFTNPELIEDDVKPQKVRDKDIVER